MTRRSLVVVLAVVLSACPEVPLVATDGAVMTIDSGPPARDSGVGVTPADSGFSGLDASVVMADAGAVAVFDAGAGTDAGFDSGVTVVDAGSNRFTTTLIDAGTLLFNGTSYRYQLLRFEVEGKAPSYGQYFPPPDGGTGPIVVVTQPYAAAAWTGEEVDSRWAAKATMYALYPDTDCPGFDGGDSIIYQPMTVADGVGQSFIYLYHGLGVLQVFERFYTGGSIQNDVDDTTAAFRFLAAEPTVKKDEIAIFGGSWGGFEAVYGAMRAPAAVRPKLGLVAYPLTDFEVQEHYLTHLDERFTTVAARDTMTHFFAPYRRRIAASTATQGFSEFNSLAVRTNLKTPLVIIHDSWDVLVPIEETRSLVDAGIGVDATILPHIGAAPWDTFGLKHFPVAPDEAHNESAVITFATAHLLVGLTPATQTLFVPVDSAELHAFFVAQHAVQQAVGGSMTELARRMNELADPRIWVFEPGGSFAMTGDEWITGEVNSIWGTSFTKTTIKAQLAMGLPP